jgi:hypothetical protein
VKHATVEFWKIIKFKHGENYNWAIYWLLKKSQLIDFWHMMPSVERNIHLCKLRMKYIKVKVNKLRKSKFIASFM